MSKPQPLKVLSLPEQEFYILLKIPEKQARALDALTGYNIDQFLELFYKNMGKHYMKPYENAFKEFLAAVHKHVPMQLAKFDKARAAFTEACENIIDPNKD